MNSIAPRGFEIITYRAEHLAAIHMPGLSAEDAAAQPNYVGGAAPALATSPFAYTAIEAGAPIACAGVFELWPGRAQAWAFIGVVPRRRWPAITAAVLLGIEDAHAAGYRRIEATVVRNFAAGSRWLQMLGFTRRCLLPVYDPFGNDHWLFDKVR